MGRIFTSSGLRFADDGVALDPACCCGGCPGGTACCTDYFVTFNSGFVGHFIGPASWGSDGTFFGAIECYETGEAPISVPVTAPSWGMIITDPTTGNTNAWICPISANPTCPATAAAGWTLWETLGAAETITGITTGGCP
ncbi:MAG TPA: hypothetical protein VFE47_18095 [Tepidisphaeraceae bacterium]|jgi:hypothetical protein|nr:hypothetical protein [Tepidisphaeraceae bacterium]